jgi:aminomethyltransferase
MAVERSPLDAIHRALDARMVPFGGWEMPLNYQLGTVDEHLACRSDAVVFDVSHLGTVRVEGTDAFDRLQWAFCNDLGKIAPGRAQYTHLLDEQDGSVLDDIIVWWIDNDTFDVMPNASNTDRVRQAIGGTETTLSRAVLAVQGPRALERLSRRWPQIGSVGKFRVQSITLDGVNCLVAGTGYTGERGAELAVPAEHAGAIWEAILSVGVVPAGLGARDTLRLEAGLPLHGHELGPGITPGQAGLDWVVALSKDEFRGRSALVAERERGLQRRLVGIATEGRRPPRADCTVWGASDLAAAVFDHPLGAVTSGNYSPTLEHGIAMAFVDADVPVGRSVEIDVRGQRLVGTVVSLPFVRKA